MGAAGRIRIATHIEVTWLDDGTAMHVCPNCGEHGAAARLLDIDYRPPDAAYHFILHICPHCTARFVDNPETMDYSSDELIEIGWNIYQVQLGAGLWPISAPLSRIDKPAGARVLEIGGAFGFGLDFCVRAKGWRGEGYDPSPLALFGARELGLDISQTYFGEAELARGPWDVVLATELIEHLADPPAFFRLMRAALAADGVLMLTTPDAEVITPGLDNGSLLPLLSPGAHLVLQTAASLRAALMAAGFAHVIVERSAMSLKAYASAAPFALIDDAAASRAMYREYLVARSAGTDMMSDMRLGYAGRAVFEAANDGDLIAGERAWQALLPAVQTRFGIDLTALGDQPDLVPPRDLAGLARVMPLGLGIILFGRAMHLAASLVCRAGLLPMLLHAEAAIRRLQDALGARSLCDALSDDVGRAIRAEILLCRAEAGDAETVDGLVGLGDVTLGWRGLVALVNAGRIDLAADLKARMLGDFPPDDVTGDLRRNILLSLANFTLAPGGDSALTFHYAGALRRIGHQADQIILAAFTRLVNAGRYDEARAAAQTHGIDRLAIEAGSGVAGADARLAFVMLELGAGDPAVVPARLASLAIEPARRRALLLEAFIRLVNAARHDDARVYLRDHDIAGMAGRHGGVVARDAMLALFTFELTAGDPAAIPVLLAGLDVEPAQRHMLLLEAFIRLVNAERYNEARALADAHDLSQVASQAEGERGQNAALALLLLELATGDPALIPARLAGLEIAPERRDELLLEAFIRLVNASRFAEAWDYAARHEVPILQTAPMGVVGDDAAIALAVLDLACGDPADVPRRFAGRAGISYRQRPLEMAAFTGLVTQGRLDAA
ncbi:MAG: class I SAM-dependent methyltransferase [Acidocella sp.]|nr:class I SAM-dependent methyltransferase [Acidocella sp.]